MPTEAAHYRILLGVFALITGASVAATQLPASPELAMRQQMVQISRQLGVTCAYCHNTNDLKSRTMETHKTAAAHLKMVEELNLRRVRGLPKVDCYMCHQGHAKAPYHEILDRSKEPSHELKAAESKKDAPHEPQHE